MGSLLIVIPAHNEAESIGLVIRGLMACGFKDLLVVDDASTDRTSVIAKDSGARVMSLAYNLGAWKATQAGLRYALSAGYKKVITFDADGQHLPETLRALLSNQHKSDLVIGSCPERGSLARHLAWAIFRSLSGVGVKDLTSGLRLYNRHALEVICSQNATLLEYQDVGVLLMLRTYSITKSEVPVKMATRKNGISRIFYSWGAVAYYMAYTTMLCVSKIAKTHKLCNQDTYHLIQD